MRLTGRLDTDALEKAINEVMRRHEVFRTTFATGDGEPVQVINEGVHLELTVEDISGEGEDRPRVGSGGEREAFRSQPRAVAAHAPAETRPEDHVALFTVHHIISDGWSWACWCARLQRSTQRLSRQTLAAAGTTAPVRGLRGLATGVAAWKCA